jgi:hypothetical protein
MFENDDMLYSPLGFTEPYNIDMFEINDTNKFIEKIEWTLDIYLLKSTTEKKIQVLALIASKVEPIMNMWKQSIDRFRVENCQYILKWIKGKINELKTIDKQNPSQENDQYSAYWNNESESLFNYLVINYIGAIGKQKFKNIFTFLNNVGSNSRPEIEFKFTVSLYSQMINQTHPVGNWSKNNKPNNWEFQEKELLGLYDKWKSQNK